MGRCRTSCRATQSAPRSTAYAARLEALGMEARVKDDDATESSGDSGAFAVRCQGAERAWEVAGVTRDTSARELKALLEAASGIEQGSVRLIFQGAGMAARRATALAKLRRCAAPQGACSPTMRPWGARACTLARAPCTSPCARRACLRRTARRSLPRPRPPTRSRARACATKTWSRCAWRWRRSCAPWPRSRRRSAGAHEKATSRISCVPALHIAPCLRADASALHHLLQALGCAVGLLLGFVAMMCLLEPTASRRMRAGLFLGAHGAAARLPRAFAEPALRCRGVSEHQRRFRQVQRPRPRPL